MYTYYFFSFVLGSIIGSGMLCLVERMLDGEDWIFGKSHCDACFHPLSLMDMIPVVSYALSKGKCRYCGTGISKKYWMAEVLMGTVFLVVSVHYRDSYIDAFREWGLFTILFCVSLIDIRTYIIPDSCIMIGIAWFIECAVIKKDAACMEGILFACVSFSVLTLLTFIMEKVLRKECLGGGDLKLLFMTDLYLGVMKGMFCIFFSCLFALLFMMIRKKKLLPFGPFLACGCLFSVLFAEQILWYCKLFTV